jgi:hypothetical protein
VPRARNIKPGFFANEALAELPPLTRLLFIGLWTIADRDGRLEDRPKRIKMALFPADNFDVDEALNELAEADFVQRYEVDRQRYIQVTNFRKHQTPHVKEGPSTIPAPDKHQTSDASYNGQNPVQVTAENRTRRVQALDKHYASIGTANPLLPPSQTLPPLSPFPDSLIPDSGLPPLPAVGGGAGGVAKANGHNGHARSEKRGTRLPADWEPDEEDRAFCKAHGFSAETTAAVFRDHWISVPGAKGLKLDWHATFRNWVRKDAMG